MNQAESDYYKVWLDAPRRIAMLFWKRDVRVEECQEGIGKLFQVVKANKVDKCLIDTSNRGPLSQEAEEWELSMLQDDSISLETKELQLALLMNEQKYRQMIQDYSLDRVCKFNLPITITYFTKAEEALDWLENDSATQHLK